MQMIQNIGSRAKDLNRFSKCTEDGGCGRYVCPDCCGACPLYECRDIQCKVRVARINIRFENANKPYRTVKLIHGLHAIGMIIEAVVP